jgi:hypothetical protein
MRWILLLSVGTIFVNRGTIVVAEKGEEEQDDEPGCETWAMSGECNLNPRYMLEHCPYSCGRQAELDKAMAEKIGENTWMWYYILSKRTTSEISHTRTMYS